MKKLLLGLVVFVLLPLPLVSRAQNDHPKECAVKVYFRKGALALDENYMNNQAALKEFAEGVKKYYENSTAQSRQIYIRSSVSPEGDASNNSRLAKGRAKSISDWVSQYVNSNVKNTIVTMGTDWGTLIELVHQRDDVPYRDEVVEILENDYTHKVRLNALKNLRGGEPYKWLYTNLFPYMRYASARCEFWLETAPANPEQPEQKADVVIAEQEVAEPTDKSEPVAVEPKQQIVEDTAHTYMSIKTNMLYDLVLIPNIGLEFYLGNNISLAANAHFSWWYNDSKAYYWRAVGGDVALRYWFGQKSHIKPLTGHHIGVYGQTITYDFELGGKGFLADKFNWAAGVEYGYSLPIARRLNLDFTAGVGYHWGIYEEYLPIDGHYAWQATKRRKYLGPTKLEVSLVWLIGSGNYNKEKEGKR